MVEISSFAEVRELQANNWDSRGRCGKEQNTATEFWAGISAREDPRRPVPHHRPLIAFLMKEAMRALSSSLALGCQEAAYLRTSSTHTHTDTEAQAHAQAQIQAHAQEHAQAHAHTYCKFEAKGLRLFADRCRKPNCVGCDLSMHVHLAIVLS